MKPLLNPNPKDVASAAAKEKKSTMTTKLCLKLEECYLEELAEMETLISKMMNSNCINLSSFYKDRKQVS